MLVANPIYDPVFKYLMEDNRVAKLIISTIINEEIEELEFRPQERTAESKKHLVQVYRLDFTAKIKTKEGKHKNILIEIQKAKFAKDLTRFRKYLGGQYIRTDIIKEKGEEKTVSLPIITIYLLGFQLEGITAEAVKINRTYIDAITGEEIHERSDFIEQLTHNSHVIQIPRLKSRHRNKLEELLSIFDQNCIQQNDPFVLNIQHKLSKEFEGVATRLERAVLDKEVREELELIDEVDNLIDEKEREYLDKIETKDKALEENKKVIEEKDKVLEEKDKVLEEKDKVLEEKDKVLEEQKKEIEELRKKLGT